ncbi:MAG TPA: hypothetical protein VGH44_03695 [Candidatus Saccharimonadia bacterium]|jgi:hypothetical protein
MSKRSNELLSDLLIIGLGCVGYTLFQLFYPSQDPPSPSPIPSGRPVVSLDELSVADIGELPPGHLAPMSDRQNLATHHSGEKIVCGRHSYYVGPLNTHLITYANEPQYTHLQHECPAVHRRRLLSTQHLDRYMNASYRVIVRSAEAEPGVRRILGKLTPDQVTEQQLAIYQAGIQAELAHLQFGLEGLPDYDEPDPVIEAARTETV